MTGCAAHLHRLACSAARAKSDFFIDDFSERTRLSCCALRV